MVHLFTEINHPVFNKSERGHYSIPISTILGSAFRTDNDEKEQCKLMEKDENELNVSNANETV